MDRGPSGFTPLRRVPFRTPLAAAAALRETVAGRSVCDLGCGEGDLLLALAPFARRTLGIERDPARARAARERGVEAREGDYRADPLPDAQVYYLFADDAEADTAHTVHRIVAEHGPGALVVVGADASVPAEARAVAACAALGRLVESRLEDRCWEIRRARQALGEIPWRRDYFNNGVAVLSRAHRRLFEPLAGDVSGFSHHDQTLMNHRAARAGHPLWDIGLAFNCVPNLAEPRAAEAVQSAYIVHLAGEPADQKARRAAAQLRAWERRPWPSRAADLQGRSRVFDQLLPAPTGEFSLYPHGGEIRLTAKDGRQLRLNAAGALAYALCDGSRAFTEIAAKLAAACRAEDGQAAGHLAALVNALLREGALWGLNQFGGGLDLLRRLARRRAAPPQAGAAPIVS